LAAASASAVGLAFIQHSLNGAPALLDISVESPATISIDGKSEQVSGMRSIAVEPGIPHIVRFERTGEIARQLELPKLKPREHISLKY
jgi:hypothetical protein